MRTSAQKPGKRTHGAHAPHGIYLVALMALLAADVRADGVVPVLRTLLGGEKPAEAGTQTKAPAQPVRLRWNNGESIPGDSFDGDADAVRWKTSLFGEPLEVRWHALRRIDQPVAAVEVKEPFSIVLRDGSHVCGDLIEVTDRTITIRSARHGDAVLKRAEVLSVRRLSGGNLIASGPTGDVGWKLVGERRTSSESAAPATVPLLLGGAGGALVMPYWNRGALLKDSPPDLVDAEFGVRSSGRPDFRFALAAGLKRQVNIETWDDELVLNAGDDFKLIRKIADGERVVALRVCWDVKATKCSVFTPAGELLTEWQPPEENSDGYVGLRTFNKGRDLSLEFLRIRKWDGKPPPKVDVKSPRLELANGDIVAGEVIRASAGSLRVKLKEQTNEQDLKLADVDALYFSGDEPKTAPQEAVLSFADGTHLEGKIDSIKDGSIAVRASFADEPVKSKLDGLRQIMIEAKSPDGKPPEFTIVDMDNLKFPSASLHGKLVADGSAHPKWLAIGGVKPAALRGGDSFEITRAFPAGSTIPTAPALFYTRSGDILPGSLRTLDRTGVDMESEIMDGKKLPAEALNAIQFGASAQLNLKGFTDPGWRVIKGGKDGVRHDAESLSMEPGTSFGHVAAMQSSEIKFSMAYGGMSTVRLRLFCAGLDGEKSSNVMISHWGSHVYSGLETGENQLENQVRTGTPSGKPLAARLVVKEKSVDLNINGVLVQTFNIATSKRPGSGLIIEPASLWGNSVYPLSLTHFSAHSVPGMTWLPDVNAETRMHALMVPRFRKDDPARHALIAANGDVLRGEIEAATATHFGFRSGLETLHVPRDRVKAAIWLKKPLAESPASVELSPQQKLLEQKIDERMRYSSAELRSLIGALERVAAGLKFKLPAKEDSRRFPFQFGGQTVGEALDGICALFGLRHHFDKDGIVVLDAKPVIEIAKNMVKKSYWLAATSIVSEKDAKGAGPPEDFGIEHKLAWKGVPLPPGASVNFDPASQVLESVNTEENQEKLLQVLRTDFGGTLGSPTHWLLLANGARLGLEIEKFAPDMVLGRHPIYGVCRVPTAQVYTIRTSKPEPTSTMSSLGDWRLVHAPEPVLPETGGESSPLLGKPAPPFKLPLLGGGDFDLAQQKGKVVVLDFWATWCGPCVKSLPGLIEAMSAFPSDQVKLIGANQGEGGEVVKRFLEARNLRLTVAMDGTQSVARQYGVDGIPHTVIIGPDGKVAWVKTGFSPEGDTEAANAVKGLLAKP